MSKNPSLGTGNLWPAVALLTRLTLLDVRGCGLRSLLDGSFSLPELIDLRADDNVIEEIDIATKAPALRRLSLARNRLSAQGIPTSLLRLASLSHLDLQGNPLTKRRFLDIPGCDDFLKRREEHREEAGAASSRRWASAGSTTGKGRRRFYRRRRRGTWPHDDAIATHHVKFVSVQVTRMPRGDRTGTDRVVMAPREKSITSGWDGATMDTPKKGDGGEVKGGYAFKSTSLKVPQQRPVAVDRPGAPPYCQLLGICRQSRHDNSRRGAVRDRPCSECRLSVPPAKNLWRHRLAST